MDIDKIFSAIWEGKEWIFSGIGVVALGFIGKCKLRSNGMPVPLLRNGYSIFNGTKYR